METGLLTPPDSPADSPRVQPVLGTVAESPPPRPPMLLSKAGSASAGELSDRSIELQSKPLTDAGHRCAGFCLCRHELADCTRRAASDAAASATLGKVLNNGQS